MTAERLARLLAWSDTQAHVYGDGVKRLARERVELLMALDNAAKALRFVHGNNTCAEQAVRDAIAKAES